MSKFKKFVTLVGAYKAGLPLASLLYTYYNVKSPHPSILDQCGANSWAVVTGASEGIGESYALELASQGFNICLIARRKDKLEEVA